MPFVGKVVLEPIEEAGTFDRGKWKVVEPMIYKSARYNVVISVPPGFVTDLASVPRILPLTFALTGATSVKAAVVHDWIYSNQVYLDGKRQMLPREVCDDIFEEISQEEQVPGWRRSLMWVVLRATGWTAYGEEEK